MKVSNLTSIPWLASINPSIVRSSIVKVFTLISVSLLTFINPSIGRSSIVKVSTLILIPIIDSVSTVEISTIEERTENP